MTFTLSIEVKKIGAEPKGGAPNNVVVCAIRYKNIKYNFYVSDGIATIK